MKKLILLTNPTDW